MKISERKERLRARGIVPVSQEVTPRKRTVAPADEQPKATGEQRKAASTAKGTTPQARPRWQPSAGYQLVFGAAYVVFAPILFYENFFVLRGPHSKYHPGAFEIIMPVVFFLFGLWWVYRGLQARRRKAAPAETTTTRPAARPRLLKRPRNSLP